MKVKPYTKKELNEIAHLRDKKGWSDSQIYGWMKVGNNRRGSAPPIRSTKMATKKAGKKKVVKKVVKKTPAKKAAAKPGRKAGEFKIGETITAIPGMEDKFYKKFPRYKAYQLLLKKKSMKTSAFVDAIEKLEGVKTRGQALGILTKLINKDCAKAK